MPDEEDDELVTFGGPDPRPGIGCCDEPRIEVRFRPMESSTSGQAYTREDAHCVECGTSHDPRNIDRL